MKRHSINVTKQCAFRNEKGRCKRKTTKTHPYCGPHTDQVLGLRVAKSTIPLAGMGLFATRGFKKDEVICEYGGEKLTVDQYDRRYGDDAMGSYGIQLDSKHIIDARKTSAGVARYACDYHGSGRRPNAEYVTDGGKIHIVATRRIAAGEEILTDYGDEMHRAMGIS